MSPFKIIGFLSLTISILLSHPRVMASDNDCYGFQNVGLAESAQLSQVCLGKALDASQISWKMPRKLLIDQDFFYVTDLGSWNPGGGKLWKIHRKSLASETIYKNGDRTHGLQIDQQHRLLIGDATKVLRQQNNQWVAVISHLPSEGSHPLTEFLVLPNNDIVLNVGAPSNACVEEMNGGTNCPTRDSEGEIRLYRYSNATDTYQTDYQVIARGLRNSMGLEYNPLKNQIYQAENNIDEKGIAEELNVIDLNSGVTPDFGWPYCVGQGQQSPLVPQVFANFCNGPRSHQPLFLIPAHSAPLDLKYYQGNLFPELKDSLIMGWHGWRRESDWAVVAYATNADKTPSTSQYLKLIFGVTSSNEKIRPVGLDFDEKGAIWFVDDKSKTLYVAARGNTTEDPTEQIEQWTVEKIQQQFSPQALNEFDQLYQSFLNSGQSCTQCHSEGQFQNDSLESLAGMMNIGWLKPHADLESQLFVFRMFGPSGKAMPPAPEDAYSKQNPTVAESLKDWVEKNLVMEP